MSLFFNNNYKINNLYDENVFHKLALSNKKGVSKIYYSDVDENIGTTSLLENFNVGDNDIEEIDLEKLDNL